MSGAVTRCKRTGAVAVKNAVATAGGIATELVEDTSAEASGLEACASVALALVGVGLATDGEQPEAAAVMVTAKTNRTFRMATIIDLVA